MRITLISILTMLVSAFSYYVFTEVVTRKELPPVSYITIGFTLIAIVKNIQIIVREIKQYGKS